MRDYIKAITSSYGELFFLPNAATGFLILLMTLIRPNMALTGLVSVLSAYGFARLMKMNPDFLKSGFYTYNPLLVGFSIGVSFQITPLTLFLTVISSVLTVCLTIALNNYCYTYLGLPILSLPFIVIGSLISLAAQKYSNLFVHEFYAQAIPEFGLTLPYWAEGFFRSLGAIFFMPTVEVGILFSLMILWRSRILFALALSGFFVGSFVSGLMIGSMEQSFLDINHFNYILISLAIGGIFLIPSPQSYILSVVAVVSSTLILDAMEVFWLKTDIPAFPLPFVVITLGYVYVLGLLQFGGRPYIIKDTPEKTLDYYLTYQKRLLQVPRVISLPFSGNWSVWQGCFGEWTHQGAYAHAYDFVILDEANKSYQNSGERLEDYYAYGKPILSPIAGRVVLVVDSLIDNPIGEVDESSNWGNYLILKSDLGYHVEISHFGQKTIQVGPGDWVEQGSFLGSCGNSGYSPQPHIHIQVQGTGEQPSATLPFGFSSYLKDDQYIAMGLPKTGDQVVPLYRDTSYNRRLSFILDHEFKYDLYRSGVLKSRVTWKIKLAPSGVFYFDSGLAKLYFGRTSGGGYHAYSLEGDDPALNALYLALPLMPAAYRENLYWHDYLTLESFLGPIRKGSLLFLSSLFPSLIEVKGNYRFINRWEIEGEVKTKAFGKTKQTRVQLDEYLGFAKIEVDDLKLEKIND